MPGVTAEMFDWRSAWHGCGPCATMWDPEDCTGAVSSTMDSSLRRPVQRRSYWGTNHIIREDIGMGADELCQLPGTPRAGL